MLALTVAAVLMAVAVPNFQALIRDSRMSGAANDFVPDFDLARSEAVKRRVPVILCKSQDLATAIPTRPPFPQLDHFRRRRRRGRGGLLGGAGNDGDGEVDTNGPSRSARSPTR